MAPPWLASSRRGPGTTPRSPLLLVRRRRLGQRGACLCANWRHPPSLTLIKGRKLSRAKKSCGRQIENPLNPSGKPTGRNQNGVGAPGAAGRLGMSSQPMMDGALDAALLARRDRQRGGFDVGPGFHLDKDNQPSPSPDNIDFAALYPIVAIQNAEAVRPKPEGGERFGAQPTEWMWRSRMCCAKSLIRRPIRDSARDIASRGFAQRATFSPRCRYRLTMITARRSIVSRPVNHVC